jgi:2'-hydroxyisoflavone reductase
LRLLVLGGTKFLGRAVVEDALERGHEVTTFSRGETNPGLFLDAEMLYGDRDGGLEPLHGRSWDAVVDTSGYVPRVVRASAELLRAAVGRYCFVSSISAYEDLSGPVDEESPVKELYDPESEDVDEHYGALKAACERVVQELCGDRALVVRPGLIVGPHDGSDRFTYWARRLARGGAILAPGPPERRVQFVDVRDLGAWLVHALEDGRGGIFNATGEAVSWGELLMDAAVTWVSDEFLAEHEVGEWMELPLWIYDPAFRGMHAADVSRAVAAGLTFRPVDETVRDTAAWDASRGEPELATGLSAEREAELLAAWRARP